jgi:phage tail tube protein FII
MPAVMPLFIMESVNLIVTDAVSGAVAPGIPTHLQIQELKLPGLEENYVDHVAGGAPVAIEVQMYINRLEATFNLAGWNPDVATVMTRGDRILQRFTANGLVREKRTSKALKAQAIMEGRLGRTNPTAFRKGDLFSHEYTIRGITHYELYFGDPSGAFERLYFWDFFTSDFIVGDYNVNGDLINILELPTVQESGAGGVVT